MVPDAPVELASQVGVTTSQNFDGRPSAVLIVGWHATPRFGLEADVGWASPGGSTTFDTLPDNVLGMFRNGDQLEIRFRVAGLAAYTHVAARWTLTGVLSVADEMAIPVEAHAVAGLGLATRTTFDQCFSRGPFDDDCLSDIYNVMVRTPLHTDVVVTPVFGVGVDLFVTRRIALKLDVRDLLVLAEVPNPIDDEPPGGPRVYGNVVSTIGIMVRPDVGSTRRAARRDRSR